MKLKYKLIILLVLLSVYLISCADVTPVVKSDDPYGFWGGLWHGIIVVFAFFGSLFSDDIAIYACNNNGGWYNLGYLIGIGGFSFLKIFKAKAR